MTLINIPLTLASTAPTSMIPEVSALYATGDIEATRECIDQTVQLSMVVSAPCAMGLAVLAQPIVFLLYGTKKLRKTQLKNLCTDLYMPEIRWFAELRTMRKTGPGCFRQPLSAIFQTNILFI